MQIQSLSQEDSLEEGMATHPSILAWRVPRTEEPGGLWSIGSQNQTQLKTLRTHYTYTYTCFPGDSDGKESVCNTRDPGLIPGSRRSHGEENDYPLQYSCLENSMELRSPAGYSPWGRKESDTTEQVTLHDVVLMCYQTASFRMVCNLNKGSMVTDPFLHPLS